MQRASMRWRLVWVLKVCEGVRAGVVIWGWATGRLKDGIGGLALADAATVGGL